MTMELRDALKNIYKNLEKFNFSKEQEKALYDYGKMFSGNDKLLEKAERYYKMIFPGGNAAEALPPESDGNENGMLFAVIFLVRCELFGDIFLKAGLFDVDRLIGTERRQHARFKALIGGDSSVMLQRIGRVVGRADERYVRTADKLAHTVSLALQLLVALGVDLVVFRSLFGDLGARRAGIAGHKSRACLPQASGYRFIA